MPAATALAAEVWIRIGETQTDVVYIDADSLRRQPPSFAYLEMRTIAKVTEGSGARPVPTSVLFDCGAGTMRRNASYSGADRTGAFTPVRFASIAPPVVPGSNEGLAFGLVCEGHP